MDSTTLLILIVVIAVVVIGAVLLLNRRSARPNRMSSTPSEQPDFAKSQPPPQWQQSEPPAPAARPGATGSIPRPITPAPTPKPVPEPEFEAEPTRGIGDALDRLREEEDEESAAETRRSNVREPVEFTAYYPKEIAPNVWADLLAYVYRTSAADAVKNDAQSELGAAISGYRRVARPEQSLVMEEAQIVVTPHLTGFQFNPVSVTVGFFDAFNRADFKVRATTAAPGDVHEGVIAFTVEGIIVCEIPLYIEVNPNASIPVSAQPTAPLVTAAPPRKAYQAVFCSYSRKDLQIVERVERAYRILGFDYLRDLTTIRPGEDWDSRLLQMIEQADIFQLFWSSHSAASNAVKKEWTKALELAAARPSFIRPVFWEQPMPAPPPELSHINFAFEPTLDD